MPAYLVQLAGTRHLSSGNGRLVFAASVAGARDIAANFRDGEGEQWEQATVTAIEAGSDFEGWTFRVTVSDTTDGSVVADVTVTGAASDGLAEIGADLVTALNGTASIAGAAFATSTLTVAETTDSLGDHKVGIEILPPAADYEGRRHIESFVTSITDEGASGAALSIVFSADTATVPSVLRGVRV